MTSRSHLGRFCHSRSSCCRPRRRAPSGQPRLQSTSRTPNPASPTQGEHAAPFSPVWRPLVHPLTATPRRACSSPAASGHRHASPTSAWASPPSGAPLARLCSPRNPIARRRQLAGRAAPLPATVGASPSWLGRPVQPAGRRGIGPQVGPCRPISLFVIFAD